MTAVNINTPEYWDNSFKKEYDRYSDFKGFIRWKPLEFEHIASNIPVGTSVLDIGCGLGGFLRYLAARNPFFPHKLFGCDFSPYAVTIAEKHLPEASFYVSDVYKLPFNNDFFDVVIATEVIEHLTDYTQALKEMYRICKPNGILLLSTPIPSGKKEEDHVYEFTIEEMQDILSGYGSVKCTFNSERRFYLYKVLLNKLI